MDREADFFELFDEQRQGGRVDLLVRAKHDRATSGQSEVPPRSAFGASPRGGGASGPAKPDPRRPLGCV